MSLWFKSMQNLYLSPFQDWYKDDSQALLIKKNFSY